MISNPSGTRLKIARLLKEYREKAGLTLKEAGELLGKSNQTVSAWEQGRGQPDADMFVKLCEVYNVESVSVFFGEELPTGSDFTLEEIELVEEWRTATDAARQSALMVLQSNKQPVIKKETAV